MFGGTAGAQYDPCYHLGCDGLSNLSAIALEQMADGAAHATITLAQANQRIGGPRARAKFDVRAFPKPKLEKAGGL